MQYFKHSELAAKYHVSLKTVHNWIDAAKEGKLPLLLRTAKSGTYIANTAENTQTLGTLAEKGKKYRNTLHHKVLKPKPEFYDIYSPRQILDIINNLTVYREIPRQYNYLEGGSSNWDNWSKRLIAEKTSNILQGTIQLLDTNMDAIDRLIANGTKINVIDLGVGNVLPVKNLLLHLIDSGVLHRYIAIDISESMLSLAEKNVKTWFGNKITFEKYLRDITHERFDDLIVDDMLKKEAEKTINLVLLLGGTAHNFRTYHECLDVAYGSMNKDDLLIYTNKLDTETSRRYFDFSADPNSVAIAATHSLSPSHKYILDLMNIDESLYDVESGFDEAEYMRYIRIRMKTAITIQFKFGDTIMRNVTLEKGEAVLLFRYWHMSAQRIISEFEKIGFMLLHSNITSDRQYFLSISGVETKQLS